MAQNYVLLETIELTQTTASVTFDNIPQTGYTDLKVVGSARFASASFDGIRVKPNNATTNLASKYFQANGASTVSGTETIAPEIGKATGADTASCFSNFEFYIPNYTSANYKTITSDSVVKANATTAYVNMYSALWSNTSAITSLVLYNSAGTNFVQYSTFSIYGLAQQNTTPVTAPFATGGNIVANDGTYWYHAFLSSGTFTPSKNLSCSYLVVAGGGGGGWAHAAGGGAGGLRSATAQSLISATAYPVTIGAGGITGTGYGATSKGTNGTDSTFNSMTSTGGGAGGGSANGVWSTGSNGGSGGGGSYSLGSGFGYAGTGNTPTTSPSQGNNGAQGGTAPASGGGGGGAGGTGNSGTPGAGGIGSSSFSDWGIATTTGQLVSSTRYYAGGGGGGVENATGAAGGSGGGGAGVGSTGATGGAGIANTGGGGGGGGYSTHPGGPGGSGGSGIVIVRYPMV